MIYYVFSYFCAQDVCIDFQSLTHQRLWSRLWWTILCVLFVTNTSETQFILVPFSYLYTLVSFSLQASLLLGLASLLHKIVCKVCNEIGSVIDFFFWNQGKESTVQAANTDCVVAFDPLSTTNFYLWTQWQVQLAPSFVNHLNILH